MARAILPALLLAAFLLVGSPAAAKEPTIPVAHRGLAKHAPENTLAAFRACLALKLGFELDVRRTKDGRLVVMHDETVDRTTIGGKGKVADLKLRELRALDAGLRFGEAFINERVPTLGEVLDTTSLTATQPALILLDLKIDDARLADDLADLLDDYPVRCRVVCIGHAIERPDLRKRLKKAHDALEPAVLANKPEDFDAALKAEAANWLYLRFIPTAEQMKAARERHMPIVCVGPLFMGNEPENWRKAAAAGVDAILTDYPLEMRAALREAKK